MEKGPKCEPPLINKVSSDEIKTIVSNNLAAVSEGAVTLLIYRCPENPSARLTISNFFIGNCMLSIQVQNRSSSWHDSHRSVTG